MADLELMFEGCLHFGHELQGYENASFHQISLLEVWEALDDQAYSSPSCQLLMNDRLSSSDALSACTAF